MSTTYAADLSSHYVVIDDGQVRYPVLRRSLGADDTEASLRAMDAEEYGDWCRRVPCEEFGEPIGSQEMIDLCATLIDAGAEEWWIA